MNTTTQLTKSGRAGLLRSRELRVPRRADVALPTHLERINRAHDVVVRPSDAARGRLEACTTMRSRLSPNRFVLVIAVLSAAVLSMHARVHAAPTQQDVFKSIQDSMGSKPSESDSRPALLLLAGGALLVLVLMISSRSQRAAKSPAPLNSPGKLMKEVLREMPLKPGEMKQLKLLADAVEPPAGEELNPLALLLCPSLMAKGLQASPGEVDRKVVAQVVRKLRSKSVPGNE